MLLSEKLLELVSVFKEASKNFLLFLSKLKQAKTYNIQLVTHPFSGVISAIWNKNTDKKTF